MLSIRAVASRAEFDAITRFRYAIYVEEMNRKQKYADHSGKTIIDQLDDQGVKLYAAWEADNVVGTVRSNYLRCTDIGEYFEQYALGSLNADEVMASSITTRLMVSARHRNSGLAVRLACETYRHGLADGITIDFIDCNAHLVPYFTGLGYRPHRTDLVHPEYGAVTVMRLDLTDIAHLKSVRSPFCRVYQDWASRMSASLKGV